MVLEKRAAALRHRLLRAGEHHVDAEALQEVEALREPQHERNARGVVVLAGGGGGEGDVEQQRDVEDQRDRREELQDRERGAAHAAHPEDAAREQHEQSQEHRPERPAPRGPAVVVGDQQQRARALALAPGDDVLRRAPSEQPPSGRSDAGEIEEGEHGGEQHQPGAEPRARYREHAADHSEDRVDRIADRPGRPHGERLDHDLPPKPLEPLSKVPSRPSLSIRPRRPRPDPIDERLSLGEGVDLRHARGGIRTHTPFRAIDFESIVYAVPPPGRAT